MSSRQVLLQVAISRLKSYRHFEFSVVSVVSVVGQMMIDVLRSLLCTWQAKWTGRPPKVMKLSQR